MRKLIKVKSISISGRDEVLFSAKNVMLIMDTRSELFGSEMTNFITVVADNNLNLHLTPSPADIVINGNIKGYGFIKNKSRLNIENAEFEVSTALADFISDAVIKPIKER